MANEFTGQDVNVKIVTDNLRLAIEGCSTEEDLRVGMELVLRNTLPDLPKPKYEKAIKCSTFTGRADAVHQGLVIEYEKPRTMSGQGKRDEAVQQVVDYLTGLALGEKGTQQKHGQRDLFGPEVTYSVDEEELLARNVGIATDGERFIFIQRRAKRWHQEPRHFDEDTVEKFLLWLRATSRKDLSPENLIADFGPESQHAADMVSLFAKLVASGNHPKANVIYEEWRHTFGIIYGTEQLQTKHRDPKIKAIATAYQLQVDVEFPVLLFAVHSYYALLMKMLATEVIVAQGGLGDTFLGALARNQLHQQLRELESGEILQRHRIRNAIEEDFFGWYTEAWTPQLEEALWQMAQKLADYDIGTFQIKPDRARDLLKDLYHGLIPETVRHALGEYYTPDWLAEHTLDLAGYDGDPTKSMLDPSCGSGTFLVMAIQKVRQWITNRPIEWGSNAKKIEAVQLIRHNVVGFDLNPLAVIASRTNYLLALGPLLRYHKADFEVPVYLTDSVLLPGRSTSASGLFTQETVAFPMTVGTFDLPREVVEKHLVPDLMNLLHEAIADQHNREAFIQRSIRDLKLSGEDGQQIALGTLFGLMQDLDEQGKNRVWAKLIRNRYAALFFRHHFDFVVGNPPHVNWESLTPDWRKAAEHEYKRYGMFTLKGLASRHGGGKKDIAALFTYAVLDHFVKDGGVLGLIVHVSLFKTSGAGEGYRRFQLGKKQHFCIETAEDFKSFQPFQTHRGVKIKTRTLVFRAIKGKRTKYPVPYTVWTKTTRGFLPGGLTWEQADKRLASTTLIATPLRGTSKSGYLSPWLTIPASKLRSCRKIIAPIGYKPHYEAHAGVYTGGLNGAYFVEILQHFPDGTVMIRNLHDEGKIKCAQVQMAIEGDLLYPLLRGRSMGRWHSQPAAHILLVQNPATQRGYAEAWMQETHPLTWKYLKKFEKQLRERKAFKKFFDIEEDAFYSMYSVTQNTFASHKVVWMDISSTMKAAVLPATTGNDMIMPEHTVMLLPTDTDDEAHYVAAMMNSDPVNTVVAGYIVDNHMSTHPIENVVIPRFNSEDVTHQRLAGLSKEAHVDAKKDGMRVGDIQRAIDETVKDLW